MTEDLFYAWAQVQVLMTFELTLDTPYMCLHEGGHEPRVESGIRFLKRWLMDQPKSVAQRPIRFRPNRLTATQRSSLGMTRVVAGNPGPANSGGERRLARTVAMEDGQDGSALGVGVCR